MQDFTHTSFHPDLLSTMENALDSAVAKLPHPVRAHSGEGDHAVRRMATRLSGR
jgi:hypothetical protein